MCMVSIIVPLYRGKGYINGIFEQVKINAKVAEQMQIQLILYNDFPEEKIEFDTSLFEFEIVLINSDKNLGIHGARVEALKSAKGEFVLFLDQDDVIDEYYIEKQISQIGDADAVVCRVNNGGKLHYTDFFVFEEVVTKEFMLKNWCPIISPGQVLIRKNAIPKVWKDNILHTNGADDYFLWLCMHGAGRRFNLNQEILFYHTITGENTSNNTNQMMDSELEMIEILKSNYIFRGDEARLLEQLPDSLRRIHIKQLDNEKRCCYIMQNWIQKISNGEDIFRKFRKEGMRIAIYGAGILGINVRNLLKLNGIEIFCYIDQNAGYITTDIPVYRKDSIEKKVDLVLLTINNSLLKKELEEICKCPVISIEEI